MSETLRLQRPLVMNNKYIYPLTTYNQIILANGERWDGKLGVPVEFVPTLTSGNEIGTLTIDGKATKLYYQGSSVTLNGTSTQNASFYAPTSVGSSGQILVSNGSGAPAWGNDINGTAKQLKAYSTVGEYTKNTLAYFNANTKNTGAAQAGVNDSPSTTNDTWWHFLRCTHSNENGYYTDLAIPFAENSIYYKRIFAGHVSNSTTTNAGWVQVLDQLNYTSYALPLSGGTMTGSIKSNSETFLRSISNGSNSYGLMFRKDSSNFYILLTDKGDLDGHWNSYRPFTIDLATGKCSIDGNITGTAAALSSEISDSKLPVRLRETTSGTSADPDTFMSSGFYYAGGAGISNVNDANILTIAHTKNSWCHQLGFKFNGGGVSGTSYDGADVYTRIYNNNNKAWSNWYALLSSGNYTAYTVTKTGSGASGTWDISITGSSASCTGNAATATKLATARTIFGRSFNGTADIGGKILVHGTYTSTASSRYSNSAIEIRENNLAGSAQSDIGYAPSIGFHWSGKIAATMLFHGDGNFYLRKQDGVTRASLDANLIGNASTATTASSSSWLNTNDALVYGASGLNYFNASLGTTASATSNYGPTADWYHIIRMNHHNAGGYYVDLAACFHNDNLYIRRVANGTNYGYKHVWVEGNSVTSAVWNDYAEYRESDCTEFGRVLAENGDDTLSATTERLQHFAGISSDTWGFCQGETEKAKTPIAVAGRVLAYTYQERNNYKPGDCVCAAPNGTVDIMTREEVMMYPDRIVGTVSCIPEYEEWGQGDRPAVKVDGRIWIKVR